MSKIHDLQCLCDTRCSLSTENHIRMSEENHSALLPIKSDLRVTNSIRIIFQDPYIKVVEETDSSVFHTMNMENKTEKQNKAVIKTHNRYSFLKAERNVSALSYELLLTSCRFSTTEGLPGASGNKRS